MSLRAQQVAAILARYSGAAGGVAAPTLTGNPTLLAHWDFDLASTVTLSGSDIDQIATRAGGNYTLLTPGNMPAQSTRNGRKVASFDGANSEYLQIASNIGVGANGCTIAMVLYTASTATASYFDLSNGASGQTADRHNFLHVSGSGWQARKCAPAALSTASVGTNAATGMHLVILRSPSGTSGVKLNENGRNTALSGSAVGMPSGLSHFSVACRRTGSANELFATFDCFALLAWDGDIGDTATEELAAWSASGYGTTNA